MFNRKLKQRVTDLENKLWCMENPFGKVVESKEKEYKDDCTLGYELRYYYNRYDFIVIEKDTSTFRVGEIIIDTDEKDRILLKIRISGYGGFGRNDFKRYLIDVKNKTFYIVDHEGKLI